MPGPHSPEPRNGPILIVGCQRSGTSALWAAIRSHPALRLQKERIANSGKVDAKELWFLREFFLGRASNAHTPHAGSQLDREFRREFGELVDRFCSRYFAGPGGRWVAAHPADALHLGEILEILPSARVLFLTRHPQEVVWSSLHARWAECDTRRRFLRQARKIARRWREFAERCLEADAGQFGERVAVVRHERMIHEPEAVARECLAHVGEPYQPEVTARLGKVLNSSFLANDTPALGLEKARAAVGRDRSFCHTVAGEVGDLMDRMGYPDLSDGSRDSGQLGALFRQLLRRPRRSPRAAGDALHS